MNRQVSIKCEQIARMVVKGMPLTRISVEMGMSYDGLRAITLRPEYLLIEEQVRNAVVGKMDARLAKRADMQDEVEDAVPEAMKVLLEGVKKRDLKAALEVLDRDPQRQFAKTSRVQNTTINQQGTMSIGSEALAQAKKEADITHSIMEQSTLKSIQPQGEA
jgi:hypothetical protein